MFYLDTNICVYALKGRYPSVATRMGRSTPAEIKIPAMVRAELLLAAEKSNARDKTLRQIRRFLHPFETIAFDEKGAEHYARVRAVLETRGEVIGPNDLVIAATVLSRGGVLVTHNQREFQRVDGLRLEDWTTEVSDEL